MFRIPSLLLVVLSFVVFAGCGGGGSSAPTTRTVTVRVAVDSSSTPLGSLQFNLANTGTGTATLVQNSMTVVAPSPNDAFPAPGPIPGGANLAFISAAGVPNPVIEVQFTVSGTVAFAVSNVETVPAAATSFVVTIL